ncbi:MAG: hypothetical protein ACFB4I_10970 [Cyanophyceae cyanobacterium]
MILHRIPPGGIFQLLAIETFDLLIAAGAIAGSKKVSKTEA